MAEPGQPGMQQDTNFQLSSLATKIRINEQNILNSQRRIQLLSRNFLDFKTEIRDKVDSVLVGSKELKKSMKALEKKIEKLEKKAGKAPKLEAKPAELNTFKAEMTNEEASKVLDNILAQAGEAPTPEPEKSPVKKPKKRKP